FAARPEENLVRVVANDGLAAKAQVVGVSGTELRIRMPFGAGSGRIVVDRGTSEVSSPPITVRTSISGFVEQAQKQPDGSIKRIPIVGVKVRLYNNPATEQVTSADGSFLLPDVPAGLDEIEVITPASSALPFPNPIYKLQVAANRDNQVPR